MPPDMFIKGTPEAACAVKKFGKGEGGMGGIRGMGVKP